MSKLEIKEIDRHRNGIGGEGFTVVAFRDTEENRNMVAVVHGQQNFVSVLDTDMLAKGVVTFGFNSWRGDTYEHELRLAIRDSVYAPSAEGMKQDGWAPKEIEMYSREVPSEEWNAWYSRQAVNKRHSATAAKLKS